MKQQQSRPLMKKKRRSRNYRRCILYCLLSLPMILFFVVVSFTTFVLQRHSQELPNEKIKYHVIFSTGCSVYQDWQSYVFFYHARKHQPWTTTITTRIVSGCSSDEEAKLRNVFQEQIQSMSNQFRIHFTPDFSTLKPGVKFNYFNKPLGTKHWLEHAMGFPNNPRDEDAIVILMDPDQIILRPFQNNDFRNTIWKFLDKKESPRISIAHGYPMGQLYGFDLQWKDKVNMSRILPDEVSPVDSLSRKDARKGYVLGPPYIATARDMYKIAVQWSSFVPKVHDEYPHLLAEMFAYSLAAAHLQLSHQTAVSFMISDTRTGNAKEGWEYIENIPDDSICDEQDPEKLPNVFHYCQRYNLGPWFFSKRTLPNDFLSCESPLLAEPPRDLLLRYTEAIGPDGRKKDMKSTEAKKNAFSVCRMIKAVNEAAEFFKKKHCTTANTTKSLMFVTAG